MRDQNIVYIPETKDFMIDGKVVRESELPAWEATRLKKLAQEARLLNGNGEKTSGDILLS